MTRTDKAGTSRRSVLRNIGMGAVGISLAGCLSGGGNGSGSGSGSGGGNGSGSGGGGLDSVTLGIIHAQSGAYGFYGVPAINGSKMAIEDVRNSDDILPNTEITAVTADSEGSSDTALQRARELVRQEQVDYLVGGTGSTTAASLSNVAFQEEVPYMIPAASSITLTSGEDCRWTTSRVGGLTTWVPLILSRYGVNNVGKDGFLIYPDYQTGYEIRDTVNEAVPAAGGSVVESASLPTGHEEWGSVVSTINSADPDWIIIGHAGSGVTAFLQTVANRGLDIPILAYNMTAELSGGLTEETVQNLPKVYRGVRYTREIDTEANNAFVEAYTSQYDGPPTQPAGYGYISTRVALKNINKANSADAQQIIQSLEGTTFDTLIGSNMIRKCDHQGTPPMFIAEFTGLDTQASLGNNKIIRKYDSTNIIKSCSEVACQMDRPW